MNQAKALLILILIAGSMNLFAQYPVGSPVAINGKLKLVGNKLSNECGNPVQLRGMSSHGLQWYSNCVSTSSLNELTNNWGIDIFRLAMYVQEGGYVNSPSTWKTYIDTWVDECANRGIYCIIDWHVLNPGDPNSNLTESKDFWTYMATKHGSKKHVLYEICNEPNGVTWSTVKTYANAVIPVIRAIDPNTVIIVGTPNWSQDVDIAAADPLTYSNIMYTLHFYSGSHAQALRDKGNTAMSLGAALFVTECGTSDASGNNGPYLTEFTNWVSWMASNNISWCNWSFSDKSETSAALSSGSCSASTWTSLSTSGTYIKSNILSPVDNFVCASSSTVTISITSPTTGTTYAEGSNITINANASTTNGTISQVDFYQGTTLIGTDNSSPYSITWSNVTPGTYYITATATNAASETATSSAVTINVLKAIFQTSTAPTIDGTVDALWSSPTAANLGTTLSGTITSTDLSANWKALWDATNLYVLVTVSDDAKINNGGTDTYNDDEVEVYIDINNNKATTYGTNDFQYTFRWNDATLVRESHSKSTTGIVRATTNTTTGYITEISIPWSTLTGTPAINQLVGFDVMVNDDDDGGTRDAKIAWNATVDDAWENPSLMGTVILQGTSCTTAPTTANAGTDQNICGATTATLGGNTASVGTGAWSVVSGTATITTTASATSTVTGLAANGTTTLRWTISNGTCTASTNDVVIKTYSTPTTANAGADQNICGATTATLSGNAATSGTSVWSIVSGTATITNTASATSTVTGLAANGTATLRWTISNGTCTASTDDVVIKTYSTPTTANAGADQNICGATTATLSGNAATSGTGAWSIVSGTATITNTASATSTVTGLAANGTATLRWTISNGTCTASTDDVVINTYSTPTTANAGADQNICEATTATLAGNTASSGNGVWSVVSGTPTITTTASATSTVTGLAANSTATLRWTISNGTCTASTDDIVINTYSTPTTANAGADQNICGATTATLGGNTVTSGTGTWSVVSGTATITTTASATSPVTGLAANGTATLRWTISNGTCTASTDDVIIKTYSTPTTANAGADQNICGATTATLSGNAATSGTGVWSVVTGTATITTTASATSTVTGLVANGTATLRWTISNGTCTASTDDVVIKTYSTPTTANAGTDQNICGATTTTLAGITASSGNGVWSVVSGTATITTTASATSTVTGLAANGTATLRWTISNGTCTASTDDVVIKTYSTPTTANAGADQNICGTITATLAGNTATSGTGAWLVVSGTATITTTASATSTVTGLAANGTATLRWTISNGTCTASTDDIVINTYSTPTTANAGADQNICGATTSTLAGNTASSGNGVWSVVSGTATITTTASATSTVTGLAANGTATLRWTISNGTCTASTDDVIIKTYSTPTTANAGADQNICGATTATLAGNTATSGTGVWSVVSGTATITTTANATSTVTGLAANGTATLRWTISNGTCTASTDDVIIKTYSTPTTANAGTDQNICGATTATLAGNTASSGNGIWSVVSGTATITTTASATSTVTGLAANGTATLRWTISNGTCTSSTDDVVIKTNTSPTTANAGADQSICNTNASLSANIPSSGTGTWSILTGSAFFTNVNSPTSTVSGLGTGTNTFRWTVSNGACASSTDDITITVSGAPSSSNAGADQNICTSTTNLSANSPTLGAGAWSIVSGSATIENSSSPATSISSLDIGTVTLRWTISNGACSSSDDVMITRAATSPAANAGADQNITSSTTILAANTASPVTGTWSVISGTAIFADVNSPTTSVSGLSNGSNILRWSISGTCGSSTDDVTISVGSVPTTSSITGPTNVTANQTGVVYSVTDHPGSTFIWTIPAGATIVTDNGSSIVVDFGTSGGDVTVVESNDFGSGSTVSETISVGSAPTTSPITGPTNVTPNQTGVVYSVTDHPGSTYTWTVPDGAIIVTDNGSSIVVNFGTSGGDISVVESNDFGSGNPVSTTVSMPSGVQGTNAIGEAKIYPNPFQDEAIINIQSISNLPFTLKISDLNGKEIIRLENQFVNEDITIGKELSQGVYLIQATQGDKIQVIRLVKIK